MKAYLRYKDYLNIPVIDYGLPTGCYIGRIWRTSNLDNPLIFIIMNYNTDGYVLIKNYEVMWTEKRNRFPKGIRNALKAYQKQWPYSAGRNYKRLLK